MNTNTFVVIIGSSEYPKSADRLTGSSNFLNSARGFLEYLTDPDGMSVPASNILNLFDSEDGPSTIDEKIFNFLSEQYSIGGNLENLILFYVGHGLFTEDGQKYCLALRNTRVANIGASAYRFSTLAHTLNRIARKTRRFIIIDACYAAAAAGELMPQGQQALLAESQIGISLAESGTALLCAASSSDVALSPKYHQYTMFSEALLHTLMKETKINKTSLSFDDIRDGVSLYIKNLWLDEAVHPELHIPDQRKGDISKLAFFPNVHAQSQLNFKRRIDELCARMDQQSLALQRLEESSIGSAKNFDDSLAKKFSELKETIIAEWLDHSLADNLRVEGNGGAANTISYETTLQVNEFKTGRYIGLIILSSSLMLLVCQTCMYIYLSTLHELNGRLPDSSKIVGKFLGYGFITATSLVVILIASFFLSSKISPHWISLEDINDDISKLVYRIQRRNYRKFFYSYVIQSHPAGWGLFVFMITSLLSIIYMTNLNI